MSPLFNRDSSLLASVDHLAELMDKQEEHIDTWQNAVGQVCHEATNAHPNEIRQAQQRLAEMTLQAPLILAALFALGSGTLVERGADVDIPAGAIFERTHEALILSTKFGHACLAYAREQGDAGNSKASIEECVNTYGTQVAKEMMESYLGWQALGPLSTASLAIVTRSAEQREYVCNNAEFMQALQECPAVSTLTCLSEALELLTNEELIVLHPASLHGYRIRISNIGLNFELHTLLADALIGDPDQGWLAGKRPDPRVVAAAKDGPFPLREDDDYLSFPHAEGSFNLWNWQGLQPNSSLPSGFEKSEQWIWNEGKPADIKPFEGTRIILLGPPPYARSWNAGRYFPQLKGELEVLEKLPEQQVKQWLSRIASAVADEQSTSTE